MMYLFLVGDSLPPATKT